MRQGELVGEERPLGVDDQEVVDQALRVLHLGEAEVAPRCAHRLAQSQFKYGLVDYLIVIDAERTLLANRLSLAQAVNLHMAASIQLVKALGGGWDPSEDGPPR